MYINTGAKVLGLGASTRRSATFLGDEFDPPQFDDEYKSPPYVPDYNPIVAPPDMPDWNPAAANSPSPVYSPPIYNDPIGNTPPRNPTRPENTIVNTPGVWGWAGQIFNPIIKAAVPIATAAGTRAILGSTAVVDPKTGLPVLSSNTGQPLYANGSGGVSTNPNANATALAGMTTPLLIGAGVVLLVLLLKKK